MKRKKSPNITREQKRKNLRLAKMLQMWLGGNTVALYGRTKPESCDHVCENSFIIPSGTRLRAVLLSLLSWSSARRRQAHVKWLHET